MIRDVFPPGTRPVMVELLNGDMQIRDAIEDAPLITISGHNGVSAKAWVDAVEEEVAILAGLRK